MNNEEEQFIHSDSRKINTDPQEQQAYESRSINSDMREQPWLREEFPQNGEKLPQKPSRHIPRSYIIGLIIVAVILALIGSTLIYTHSVVKVIASTPSKTPTQGSTVTPTQGSTVTPTQGSTVKPTLRPTATPIPRPTATPSLTVIPSPGTFGFENGSQNWGTSEGNFKLAKVDVTTNLVHSGIHSLQVTTTLLWDASSSYNNNTVYLHTEATAYFDRSIPSGFGVPGPYNLTRKQVSCFVYLPSRLANGGANPTYIRIFVKDLKFANDFSTAVNIDQSNMGRWIQLSFIVGADPNNADPNFDSTKVNAIGIRIETPHGSTLNYTGPFYIDDCRIQHP